MYKNPGKALKVIAAILCILGMLVSLAAAALVIYAAVKLWSINGISFLDAVSRPLYTVDVVLGVLTPVPSCLLIPGAAVILLVGCLFSWLMNLGLAALGELVKNSTEIRDLMKEQLLLAKKAPAAPAAVPVPADPHASAAADTAVPRVITVAPAQSSPAVEVVIPESEVYAPAAAEVESMIPAEESGTIKIVIPAEAAGRAACEAPLSNVEEVTSPGESGASETPAAVPTVNSGVCAVCGTALRPGVRFCPQCGTPREA